MSSPLAQLFIHCAVERRGAGKLRSRITFYSRCRRAQTVDTGRKLQEGSGDSLQCQSAQVLIPSTDEAKGRHRSTKAQSGRAGEEDWRHSGASAVMGCRDSQITFWRGCSVPFSPIASESSAQVAFFSLATRIATNRRATRGDFSCPGRKATSR